MSYTMTIESPEKAAWFEQRRKKLSREQLGALFVSFLMQNEAQIFENAVCGIVCQPADFAGHDFVRQREAILSVAGGWRDDRTEEEIIADIETHRTSGREVEL